MHYNARTAQDSAPQRVMCHIERLENSLDSVYDSQACSAYDESHMSDHTTHVGEPRGWSTGALTSTLARPNLSWPQMERHAVCGVPPVEKQPPRDHGLMQRNSDRYSRAASTTRSTDFSSKRRTKFVLHFFREDRRQIRFVF